jgi:hypothetical protein
MSYACKIAEHMFFVDILLRAAIENFFLLSQYNQVQSSKTQATAVSLNSSLSNKFSTVTISIV